MSSPPAALVEPSQAVSGAACPRSAARDTRRQAILEVARAFFLEQGYAAASMSAIAARLGGSKGTLYNYFASKEELFSAVVADALDAEFQYMTEFEPAEGLEASLQRFGRRFLHYALSDTALGFHRLLSAEAGRFPELGRLFYAAGPERTHARLAALLERWMEAGVLRRTDPHLTASLLVGLLKAGPHQRLMWNVATAPEDRAVEAHVDAAIDLFLRGCRA